jgi:hypothetical protein
MTSLNIKACNDHLVEQLELQMRLTQNVLDAVKECEYERAHLFSRSTRRCAEDITSFLNSMIEAMKIEQKESNQC